MKIALSGSNGFIAKHLVASFQEAGHTVVPISRTLLNEQSHSSLCRLINSCEIVINLAGSSINQRWTKKNKASILSSRIESTRAIVNAINSLSNKPQLFISASAVGIYDDEAITDENERYFGSSFLAEVCKKWEDEAKKVSPEVRLVIPRLGVVLSNDGGALPKIITPFRYYVGGLIGSGEQGFSWIHIVDLIRIFDFIINDQRVSGALNVTSPQNTDNYLLTVAISEALDRPAWFDVPEFLLHLLLGERYQIVAKGAKVYPGVLYNFGFDFRYSTIEKAISSLLR